MGIDVRVLNGDYQTAIDRAVSVYEARHKARPLIVALPRRVDADKLNLHGMELGKIPSGSGVMVFGDE